MNRIETEDRVRQDLLETILDRQASSWSCGERTPVEVYLSENPVLRDDTNAVLDLIYHEFVLRQRMGEAPKLDEYLSRFPDWAELLLRQFAAHAAVPATDRSETISLDDNKRLNIPSTGFQIDQARPLISIDGYDVVEQLGRGGMGVVYKARDKALGRFVALKMIAAGRNAEPKHRERFQVEARAAARLQHPNILQIYNVDEYEGSPYLAIEYAEGGSLADRIAAKPLPTGEAARLTETLARAVDAAHRSGVVHRDLKPSNVLLTADGTPKIGDFGVAKLLDDDSVRTLAGDPIGTPSFMAPEQAQGRLGEVGPAADVYSLGAILYQLLTGYPPFLGGSTRETLNMVVSQDVRPPRDMRPEVSKDLETICLKCLRKEPAKRYATAEALADDLSRFLTDRPILARRTSAPEQLWRWSRRNRWAWDPLESTCRHASLSIL